MSKSTYYDINSRSQFVSSKYIDDEFIWDEIKKIWELFPGLGYKKLSKYLNVGTYRIRRILFQKRGPKIKHPKANSKKGYPNLLKQILYELDNDLTDTRYNDFLIKDGKNKYRKLLVAKKPNLIWQCDWKEIKIPGINLKVYIFLIVDTYTRQIKGFEISLTKEGISALKAVRTAIEKSLSELGFDPMKLIIHSDQGSAYVSNEYINYLIHMGIQISMAAKGKPTENPYAEAFISILSRFWLKHFEYFSFNELDKSIKEFIERYNSKWKHGEIEYLTPNEKYNEFVSSLSEDKKVSSF